MSKYTTRHDIVPALPDGRLVQVAFSTNGRGMHRIGFQHLSGHIHPQLLRDIDELSRQLSYTAMFTVEALLLGTPPLWAAQVERVPADLMAPLRTFTIRADRYADPFYELHCRADLVSRELVAELNTVVFPYLANELARVVQALREIGPAQAGVLRHVSAPSRSPWKGHCT